MATITLDLSLELIGKAEEFAKDKGYRMSFAVVDSGGHLVALHRTDEADWITSDIAIGKAYTVAAFKDSSDNVAKRGEDIPMFVNAITIMTQGKFTPQKGGLPIKLHGELLGAIGASGGSGAEDVEVLEKALEYIKGRSDS